MGLSKNILLQFCRVYVILWKKFLLYCYKSNDLENNRWPFWEVGSDFLPHQPCPANWKWKDISQNWENFININCYAKQNWNKIFFDRPIILGTSFSDFAENYQFFAIFLQTRPGIKIFYFSDPNYFQILHLSQECHLSR